MNIETQYMGLQLKNPLIASASPLSRELDNIKKLEDAGAAAIVMYSLFEEQLHHENAAMEHFLGSGSNSFAESLNYFPQSDDYDVNAAEYLSLLARARESTDIPIIASLNGISSQGWIEFSKDMEQAGAHGIELNTYYIPADIELSGQQIEDQYLDTIKQVKSAVSIPVAIKLSPFFSSMGHMAKKIDQVGADALVLFNRFYQPDMDLDLLQIEPSLELSQSSEIRLPLLWIAILYGKLEASLAASRGVCSEVEIIKYILSGADVVMSTSALLRNGIDYLSTMLSNLRDWMQANGYETLEQMKGKLSLHQVPDASAYERVNYIKILESYEHPYVR